MNVGPVEHGLCVLPVRGWPELRLGSSTLGGDSAALCRTECDQTGSLAGCRPARERCFPDAVVPVQQDTACRVSRRQVPEFNCDLRTGILWVSRGGPCSCRARC